MDKKRKWELEYEKYLNGNIDKEYEALNLKLESKTINKEEYKRLEKIEKIKPNISKVTNILELRTKLENKLSKLKAEQESISEIETARKSIEKAEKEMQKVEDEHKKLMEEKATLQEKLKNGELSAEEKTKLQKSLRDAESNLEKNDKLYVSNYKILADKDKYAVDEKRFAEHKASTEKSIWEVASKISKCNMVGNNLMQGASWDSIDLKLQNWKDRKLTSQERITSKVKGETDKGSKGNEDIDIEGLSEKIVNNVTESIKEEEAQAKLKSEISKEESSLVEVSEFEKKHPRLARIGNWIKNKWNAIRGKESTEPEQKAEASKEKTEKEEPKETAKTEEVVTDREDFRQYLKDVAEKGMKQTAREKLDAAKQQAYAERAAKDAEWKNKQEDTKEASTQSQEEDRG